MTSAPLQASEEDCEAAGGQMRILGFGGVHFDLVQVSTLLGVCWVASDMDMALGAFPIEVAHVSLSLGIIC